jgi:3'5'-cyclic nucleotide phosphodiesterase
MQTNSLPGKIMCSQKTKDLLVEDGKEDWIIPRDELLDVKGKGKMQCYWVTQSGQGYTKRRSSSSSDRSELESARQVSWLSEMFVGIINDLLEERAKIGVAPNQETLLQPSRCLEHPRDEVTETIILPRKMDPSITKFKTRGKAATTNLITPEVTKQLTKYIEAVGNLYRNNPFHNFKHACHVVMATKKMLSRIAASCELTSDRLTQVAIIFSALIHDVDHPGVSNTQLVIEKTYEAVSYDCKSVSEQNSVTIAWNLLMNPEFDELRKVLMPTDFEKQRFRQVVVNCVIATDLFDYELKTFRENRWSKAFETDENNISNDNKDNSNRRAAIIIELIIQASDVSHTMQHWQVYQEWNHKLFHEMYVAFQSGRLDKDPSIGWYDGELWFFDNYIIPLAHKLRTCGVFGVSCDELLTYAVDNRFEWASKGKDIVKHLVETFSKVSLTNDQDREQANA